MDKELDNCAGDVREGDIIGKSILIKRVYGGWLVHPLTSSYPVICKSPHEVILEIRKWLNIE